MEPESSTSSFIWAAFPDYEFAAQAVAAFMDHGVPKEDIQLFTKNLPPGYEDMGAEEVTHQAESGITVTTAQDARSGATKGMGIGLGVGVLAGIVSLAIPGVGLVLGGTALAAAVAGAAGTTAAGALAGAVAGYLRDQGADETFVEHMTHRVEAGDVIVSVALRDDSVTLTEAHALVAKYLGVDVAANAATSYVPSANDPSRRATVI